MSQQCTTAPPAPEPTPPTPPPPPPEVTPSPPQTTAPAEPPKPSGPPAAGTRTSPGSKPTYAPQPTTPSQGDGSRGGGTKTNPSGASSSPQEPSPSNKDSSPSSSEMQTEKTSTSVTTIVAVCGGILGGSLVILATILVWRKREQRRQRVSFDQFYNESLTAASGFNEAESSSKNYKRDSNNSNSTANHARPAYARPSDLEQGYDGYPAGPGSAPPMRHHAGYRGGPAPMPGGLGYGHGHQGHEYA
ncbi:hypothetical protein BGX34_004684 [Mortierella sp. NVP85]|nr:hypothetical protein BGX34_004684 [Mortierella sp. NVP85]